MLMIHTHPKTQRISLAALKQQALLLVGLLLIGPLAQAGDFETDRLGKSWTTPERDLQLSFQLKESAQVICPHVPDSVQQPFCREFAADPVSVCGHGKALQLVLTNGEVHRVNSALIGIDGSFEPAFTPNVPLQLRKAWTPDEDCHPDQGMADVIAVSIEGDLWHFNGLTWKRISTHRATHSN